MNQDNVFFRQAALMLEMIPFVAQEECFALKGGTAINFFLRDMPRLSVDIDLVYLPLESRDIALKQISSALQRIAAAVRKERNDCSVQEKVVSGNRVTKLFVRNRQEQITIEPNEVIRGTVYGVEERMTVLKVEEVFKKSASVKNLSVADLYGGKLCAALDRQHPRDIFDMKILLDNEGFTPEIQKAFVVYLAGHDRPIHELLDPGLQDIKTAYDEAFQGMTVQPVSYKTLLEVREDYIATVKNMLTTNERKFLLSIKEGAPDWSLIEIQNLDKLPAIQWKLRNIKTLKEKNPKKHEEQLIKLKKCLGA